MNQEDEHDYELPGAAREQVYDARKSETQSSSEGSSEQSR